MSGVLASVAGLSAHFSRHTFNRPLVGNDLVQREFSCLKRVAFKN